MNVGQDEPRAQLTTLTSRSSASMQQQTHLPTPLTLTGHHLSGGVFLPAFEKKFHHLERGEPVDGRPHWCVCPLEVRCCAHRWCILTLAGMALDAPGKPHVDSPAQGVAVHAQERHIRLSFASRSTTSGAGGAAEVTTVIRMERSAVVDPHRPLPRPQAAREGRRADAVARGSRAVLTGRARMKPPRRARRRIAPGGCARHNDAGPAWR